jgi:transglycosylase-like protein with SLT domain
MIRCLAFCLALLPGLVLARIAQASDPPIAGPLTPYAMCEAAIASAEATTKLPARVLNAIALRESGRLDSDTGHWRPWPWTINVEGIGHFYDTKEEAIAAVRSIQAAGQPSVDVGCMQVNLMHHADAFASLDDAFDPPHNAAYAGRFLMDLFTSSGDWGTAIAAYHSRTPGVGEPYRDMVVATWNPKDPAVLSKLSFQPLPPIAATISGAGMIYAPFAHQGPIQIAPNLAYRAFLPSAANYRAFRPPSVTYGDFAQRVVKQRRGRPMDFRVNLGLMNSGRSLVVPTGVVVPGREKFIEMKPPVRRRGESG